MLYTSITKNVHKVRCFVGQIEKVIFWLILNDNIIGLIFRFIYSMNEISLQMFRIVCSGCTLFKSRFSFFYANNLLSYFFENIYALTKFLNSVVLPRRTKLRLHVVIIR